MSHMSRNIVSLHGLRWCICCFPSFKPGYEYSKFMKFYELYFVQPALQLHAAGGTYLISDAWWLKVDFFSPFCREINVETLLSIWYLMQRRWIWDDNPDASCPPSRPSPCLTRCIGPSRLTSLPVRFICWNAQVCFVHTVSQFPWSCSATRSAFSVKGERKEKKKKKNKKNKHWYVS